MTYHATGMAMTAAININFMNSRVSSNTIEDMEAPITLRIPISFVRRAAMYDERPNKPRQATKIPNVENNPNRLLNDKSALYCRSKNSSRKKYSYGLPGNSCAYADCMSDTALATSLDLN